MATSPVNQQRSDNHNPLHNFSFLKWGNKSHANNLHRTRRPTDPLPTTLSKFTAQEDRGFEPTTIHNQTARKRCFDFDEEGIQVKDGHVGEMGEEAEAEGRAEELQKLWNLRPRKTTPASKNWHRIGVSVGASSKTLDVHVNNGDTVTNDANAAPKSLRLRGMAEAAHGGVEKKKERAKLWISLSKEEIEEDVFIMTGSRPARRPKRRPKTVQKQLDILFPGLSLLGATAETFKIPDSPPKK